MAPANDVSTPVPSIQAAAVTTAPAPSDIAEPASSGRPRPRPTPCRNARPPAPPRRLPRPPSRRTPRRRWSSPSRCARASASMRATPTWWSSAWSARAPRSSPTATCMCTAAARPWRRARRCHGPHLHHAPGRRAAGRCRRVSRGRGQARPLAAQPTGAGPTGRRHAAHRGPEGLTQHPIRARAQINYTHSVRSLTRAFALR